MVEQYFSTAITAIVNVKQLAKKKDQLKLSIVFVLNHDKKINSYTANNQERYNMILV